MSMFVQELFILFSLNNVKKYDFTPGDSRVTI